MWVDIKYKTSILYIYTPDNMVCIDQHTRIIIDKAITPDAPYKVYLINSQNDAVLVVKEFTDLATAKRYVEDYYKCCLL